MDVEAKLTLNFYRYQAQITFVRKGSVTVVNYFSHSVSWSKPKYLKYTIHF